MRDKNIFSKVLPLIAELVGRQLRGVGVEVGWRVANPPNQEHFVFLQGKNSNCRAGFAYEITNC